MTYDSPADEIAALERKLAASERQSGYTERVEAIRTRLAELKEKG